MKTGRIVILALGALCGCQDSKVQKLEAKLADAELRLGMLESKCARLEASHTNLAEEVSRMEGIAFRNTTNILTIRNQPR